MSEKWAKNFNYIYPRKVKYLIKSQDTHNRVSLRDHD